MTVLSEKELAKELGVSYWTIRGWRLQLNLPHFRTAGRIFYRMESVVNSLQMLTGGLKQKWR